MKVFANPLRSALAAGGVLALVPGRAYSAISPVLAQVSVEAGGSKNYVVDILVTLALFGLALWVVCKSSRRV